MVRHTTKRGFLASLGAASAASLAGCMGIGGSSTSAPGDNDTTSSAAQRSTNTETPGNAKRRSYSSKSLDAFEDLSQWKGVKGRVEPSTQGAYRGSQSARVTLNTSDELVWIRRKANWDLSEKNLSFALNVKRPAQKAIVTVCLHAPNSDNTVTAGELVRLEPGQEWFRVDAGIRSVSGAPDLSRVTQIDLMFKAVGGGPADFRVDDLRAVQSFDQGYVALTFDDGLASQYKAFQTMKQYDMPATVATIPRRVGSDGYLSLKQMKEMKGAGWEFAAHPQADASLSSLSTQRMWQEVIDAHDWMSNHGFEQESASLVYPFGEWNHDVIQFAKQNGFNAGYRYLSGYGSGSGPITDPWTISRGDGMSVSTVKTMVNLSTMFNDLRIFAFHGIGRGGNAIPHKEFEQIIEYIDQRNLKVVTLSEINNTLMADVARR